jgi:hypothetical protein
MAHYGPMWPQIPALQGLLQPYCGEVRSAMVYGLWFTRERSKVRSLVRPPFKPVKCGLSPIAKLEWAGINDAKARRGESRALNEQLILLRKG